MLYENIKNSAKVRGYSVRKIELTVGKRITVRLRQS